MTGRVVMVFIEATRTVQDLGTQTQLLTVLLNLVRETYQSPGYTYNFSISNAELPVELQYSPKCPIL